MLEIIITNPTSEDAFLKSIDFNFDELKSGIKTAIEKYDNLIVSEDGIKQAKADRANLNKFMDAMIEKRKQVKKQCLQAYEPFNEKILELVKMVEEPCKKIDAQIKSFEEKERTEKKKSLKMYFEGVPQGDEVRSLVNFDDFIKKREQLLNKTFTLNNAYAEIESWLNKVGEHLKILRKQSMVMAIDYEVLKNEYKRTDFDLCKVLEYANQIKEQRDNRTSNIPEHLQLSLTPPQEETHKRVEFWCEVTPTQAKLMQKFLKENNIKYGAMRPPSRG